MTVHLSPTASVSLLFKANAMLCAAVDSGCRLRDEKRASPTKTILGPQSVEKERIDCIGTTNREAAEVHS